MAFVLMRERYPVDLGSQFLGVIATGIAGFFWFQMHVWHEAGGRADRRQVVTMETHDTPNQVVTAAFWANVRLGLLAIGIVMAFVLVVSGAWR
jgi:hypothetical protein